ncbi:TIR domain-containing protein [Vibrio parahaemolyticus]
MSYRNKTYIIFDADKDMLNYRLMQAWKVNKKINFNFYNAHEINNIWSKSNEETIKRRLRERMSNAKQAIVLVGESTRYLNKFVRWEIEVALSLDLPIIAVNLDKSNRANEKTPAILRDRAYFVTVPFETKKIKYALDFFPKEYKKYKAQAPSARNYNWNKVNTSGK